MSLQIMSMRNALTCARTCLVATALTTVGYAQNPTDWALGLQSFGPFRYGMTVSEARAASGLRLDIGDPGENVFTGACREVHVDGANATLLFLWDERWTLKSAFVPGWGTGHSRLRTRSGIGVGSTAAEVLSTYPGRIQKRSHSFEGQEEEWLVYVPEDVADRGLTVVFKVDRGRVFSMSAGYANYVAGPEVCF